MAAARKVSDAPRRTFFPSFLYRQANFPMDVVLPTPFTPTTMITFGPWLESRMPLSKSSNVRVPDSEKRPAISSRSISYNSCTSTYASKRARFRRRSKILLTVSTPTSAVISASSRSSINSSSTFRRPVKTLASR